MKSYNPSQLAGWGRMAKEFRWADRTREYDAKRTLERIKRREAELEEAETRQSEWALEGLRKVAEAVKALSPEKMALFTPAQLSKFMKDFADIELRALGHSEKSKLALDVSKQPVEAERDIDMSGLSNDKRKLLVGLLMEAETTSNK